MADHEMSHKREYEEDYDLATSVKHIKLLSGSQDTDTNLSDCDSSAVMDVMPAACTNEDTKRLNEELQARNAKLETEIAELQRKLTVATPKLWPPRRSFTNLDRQHRSALWNCLAN